MWKICIRKNINLIFFNSLTSVIAEFPTSNFIFVIILFFERNTEPHIFVLSIFQFIWKDLVIACKSFNRRKNYVLVIGVCNWRCYAKIDVPQNSCSLRVWSWLCDQNLWKIPVKKFDFSKVADLNFRKNRTLSFAYFNAFNTDLEQLFCRSPSGCL